jgi:ABC-type tungstate transport system permease subunit
MFNFVIEMEGKILKISVLLLMLVLICIATQAADSNNSRLKLVTTTSLHDTGLLDVIKQKFEEKYNNVSLDVVSVGTGIAIQYGERGDADVLLIHDKDREVKFVKDGHGLERRCVAYNYFNIVGPKDDPAGIKGMNATSAFKTIFQKGKTDPTKVMFVSRGERLRHPFQGAGSLEGRRLQLLQTDQHICQSVVSGGRQRHGCDPDDDKREVGVHFDRYIHIHGLQ